MYQEYLRTDLLQPIEAIGDSPGDFMTQVTLHYPKTYTLTAGRGDFLTGIDYYMTRGTVSKCAVTIQQGNLHEQWHDKILKWRGLGLPIMARDPTVLHFEPSPMTVVLNLRVLGAVPIHVTGIVNAVGAETATSVARSDHPESAAAAAAVTGTMLPSTDARAWEDRPLAYNESETFKMGCRYWLGPFDDERDPRTTYWTVQSGVGDYTGEDDRMPLVGINQYKFSATTLSYRHLTMAENMYVSNTLALDRAAATAPRVAGPDGQIPDSPLPLVPTTWTFSKGMMLVPHQQTEEADRWLALGVRNLPAFTTHRNTNQYPKQQTAWVPFVQKSQLIESGADSGERIRHQFAKILQVRMPPKRADSEEAEHCAQLNIASFAAVSPTNMAKPPPNIAAAPFAFRRATRPLPKGTQELSDHQLPPSRTLVMPRTRRAGRPIRMTPAVQVLRVGRSANPPNEFARQPRRAAAGMWVQPAEVPVVSPATKRRVAGATAARPAAPRAPIRSDDETHQVKSGAPLAIGRAQRRIKN